MLYGISTENKQVREDGRVAAKFGYPASPRAAWNVHQRARDSGKEESSRSLVLYLDRRRDAISTYCKMEAAMFASVRQIAEVLKYMQGPAATTPTTS